MKNANPLFPPVPVELHKTSCFYSIAPVYTTLSCCSPSVNITSPRYPNNYAKWMSFSWTVSSSQRMSLTFNGLVNIANDFLKVYDGPSSNSSKLKEITGNNVSPEPINSSGNYLHITFVSDHNVINTGFSATIQGKVLKRKSRKQKTLLKILTRKQEQ